MWTQRLTKTEGRGVGLYVTRTNERNYELNIRLMDSTNIHTAELMAIKLAILEANKTNMDELTISTDRKHALPLIYDRQIRTRLIGHITQLLLDRKLTGKKTHIIWERGHTRDNPGNRKAHELAEAATRREDIEDEADTYSTTSKKQRRSHKTEIILQTWQEAWDNDTTGRELHNVCRNVGLQRLPLTHKATQLATGHGNTSAYLHRFNLQPTTGLCTCDGQSTEDTNHIKLHCTLNYRKDIRRQIQTNYGDLDIELRRGGNIHDVDVQKINEWAEQAILD